MAVVKQKWSKQETTLLLTAFKDLRVNERLHGGDVRVENLFNEVHERLRECGVQRSVRQIQLRWEKLKNDFFTEKMKMARNRAAPNSFPLYHIMEDVMGEPRRTPENDEEVRFQEKNAHTSGNSEKNCSSSTSKKDPKKDIFPNKTARKTARTFKHAGRNPLTSYATLLRDQENRLLSRFMEENARFTECLFERLFDRLKALLTDPHAPLVDYRPPPLYTDESEEMEVNENRSSPLSGNSCDVQKELAPVINQSEGPVISPSPQRPELTSCMVNKEDSYDWSSNQIPGYPWIKDEAEEGNPSWVSFPGVSVKKGKETEEDPSSRFPPTESLNSGSMKTEITEEDCGESDQSIRTNPNGESSASYNPEVNQYNDDDDDEDDDDEDEEGELHLQSCDYRSELYQEWGESPTRPQKEDKPISCNICGKQFTRKFSLKQHARIHTGEKPYSCRLCGKSFRRKGHLVSHMTVHSGEKPFECLVCGSRFTRQATLRQHFLVHTDGKV